MKRACWMLLSFIALALAAPAANLLSDPSFEHTKAPDRFGRHFPEWGGWVYAEPATFAVGRVAHSGSNSCCLVGQQGGKIRIFSNNQPAPAGRYRVRAFIRGLDVGPGAHKRAIDFSVGLDDRWWSITNRGTFGWSPLTYVFEVSPPAGTNPPPLMAFKLGLLADGRLWVDDVSLERVDATVALTAVPELGSEEAPIVAPGVLAEPLVPCTDCGQRNRADWGQCFACGNALVAARRTFTTPAVVVVADFEGRGVTPFSGGTRETNSPLAGAASLRLDKGHTLMDGAQDWSQHDYVLFDVRNPGEQAATLHLEVRDTQTRDYWTRVNLTTIAPPGLSTVRFPTALYVGEKARPGRALQRERVTAFAISLAEPGPVVVDNVRLERLNTAEVLFPNLQAFDFGPGASAPLMEGFQAGATAPYTAGRGNGWVGARFWNNAGLANTLQPDALTQDAVFPVAGTFRLDVPNGRYVVTLNIDSPGGYWGDVQKFRQREVLANGVPVITDTLDLASFTRRYFRNAGREDLPGVDVYDSYVESLIRERTFTVNVTHGALELEFRGGDYAIALTHLIVYPDVDAVAGQRFRDWVTERRKIQFHDYFKQLPVLPTGAATPASGYRLFARHPMETVGPLDGPRAHEELTERGLSVSAAVGEEAALVFSIQPAKDAGPLDVRVAPFRADAGAAAARAPVALSGWLDYRVSRVAMDGSVYAIEPRYWHPFPAPAASGITRTCWLRIQVPAGTAPGTYRGSVTIQAGAGAPQTVPLSVRVHPFALDPIEDLAVGPFGAYVALPWYDDDESRAWQQRTLERGLKALRAIGCTSFSGFPSVRVTLANGVVELDTAEADREMALAREQGFHHLISSYGRSRNMGYDMYRGASDDEARKAGFANGQALMNAVWQAVDAHAVRANWLRVAWNVCDEPIGEGPLQQSTQAARMHRIAGAGLQRTTFMGATSLMNVTTNDPHRALVQALPMPTLTLHDESALRLIAASGNQFAYYNGGDRWTYGRYMRMLVTRHDLALRLTWHYNVAAGDPYYALDCREDDYCWFNANAAGELVPSVAMLRDFIPGLADYRYLATLERLIAERKAAAAAITPTLWERLVGGNRRRAAAEVPIAAAEATLARMLNLVAGPDRDMQNRRMRENTLREFDADRAAVTEAILSLVTTDGT